LRRVLRDQFTIKVEGAEESFGPEFHFLRHVALDQRDADRLADRRCPCHLLQAEAADGEQRGKGGADPPADEQGATQRDE
jgi:hypothetical protein